VIQGASVRLVAKPHREPQFRDAQYQPVEPRLEDAYVELLGGARKGESLLARGWPAQAPPAAPGDVPPEADSARDPGVLVRAVGLTRRFGDFVAADTIGFEVRAGEIYGLLGPNGAGKSTTFRMLCGLLKPTEGDASVAGVNLLHAASRARARLGYMAQKFSLYGDLSVGQNLDYFADIYGLSRAAKRERVPAMIEMFELAPHLESNASLLPLGFKQRLALACATLHAPAVLFLDEPTSGVDPLMRREFWHHINALTTRGVAVLVTTHFMEEAEYCDRIGLIWRGRKIAEGTPDELKARVRSVRRPEPTLEDAFIALVEAEAA
jgi:ABC-2 type transport system ATP-binding protein